MTAPPQPSVRDWQDILALLDTALELEPAAQPQWLASLAPEQAHLSPMLAQLLRARAEVGTDDFMRPPTNLAAAAPPELAAQMLVGPYWLLREIGRGGMASVWLSTGALAIDAAGTIYYDSDSGLTTAPRSCSARRTRA